MIKLGCFCFDFDIIQEEYQGQFAGLAAERCAAWEEEERLELALTWAAYPFRCAHSFYLVNFTKSHAPLIRSGVHILPMMSKLKHARHGLKRLVHSNLLTLAFNLRPSQSSFVRTCLMLSGPSLPLLSLPSLLQYLLLVSYRADDKVRLLLTKIILI